MACAQFMFDDGGSVVPIRLFEEFYYLAHHKNLGAILTHGILSHNEVKQRRLARVDISDPEVQRWRDRPETVYNRPIHDYAPLYLNPKNPMLYVRRSHQDELAILVVSKTVLTEGNHVYADGNAASAATAFANHRGNLEAALEVLKAEYWSNFPDGRRRRCAEVLVHPQIAPKYITRGICRNPNLAAHIQNMCSLPISVDRSMFF